VREPSASRLGLVPPQGQIKVHAKSFESVAVETTSLRFPPPLAERGSNPEGFEYWWKMMEFVFALPAPETFPPYPAPPRQKEREILERFISAAGELAESTLLNSSDGVTVHVPDEENEAERVETSFSSREATRGFVVLFRQIHSREKSDPARFQRVREILKVLNDRAADKHAEERNRQIDAWAQARGILLGENLKVRVGEKLATERKWANEMIPGRGGLSPQQLISGYQYGDLIHWGHGREIVDAVANDPFERAWQYMAFLEAVTGLAHLYIGFSLLVTQAMGSTTP
jgi:hypothetical protein